MNAEAVVKAMVVADGMGGLSGGKYYSEAAVNLWYHSKRYTAHCALHAADIDE